MTAPSLSWSIPPHLIEALAHRVAEIGTTTSASPYMTADEAAEYLRWPKERIYKLTAARTIPHRKHDGRLLFHRDELDTWLNEHREGPLFGDTTNCTRRLARGG